MNDGKPCHLTAAIGAGFTAVCVGSPIDVLTTRHMNYPGRYKSPVDVITTTVREEGIMALYKGFMPNFARMAGYNIGLWMTIEQIKKYFDS